MTTYPDKYDRDVDLDLTEAQELIVRAFMKEGELRYRDELIAVLERTRDMLKEDGEESPKISINAVINMVLEEPEKDEDSDEQK